uniref:AVR-Pita1 n=1 Tax=Ganoderma boninense TaxID=34458 RepID=A0A5K1K698_9APHY|nr:AVR-Pita1 [Ganoderma boninense]
MSIARAPAIPLDICFIVIDIVANDDWLEISRAQLYRSVGLQRRDAFESFAETVTSSFYLGSLVKTLRCDLEQLLRAGDVIEAPLPIHVIRRLVGLESLAVVSESILPFNPSFVDFLKSFSLYLSMDMDSLYRLLSPTVERLSIRKVERREAYRAWAVRQLQSLKSLEFTFARDDIHWVVQTLLNNGSRVLETVAFNYLSIDQSPETVQHRLTEHHHVIDGILRARPFASVTQVVVKLFVNDPSNEGERWSKAVQAALPRTYKLKMLHFSVHQYLEADWNKGQ